MKISILGLGWLGKSLALQLQQDGFLVNGSCTSKEKQDALLKTGIDAHLIQLAETEIKGDLSNFLSTTEVLIINIPPKISTDDVSSFINKIKILHSALHTFSLNKIIFVSTTSVFKDLETIPEYTENDQPNADTNKALQLIEAENIFLNDERLQTAVIRFGGLVGGKRHPIHFLSGRENIANPAAPVNLIHRLDCIKLISKVISNFPYQAIYHGVNQVAMSKNEFYTHSALKRNLPVPFFTDKNKTIGKQILSLKTKNELNIDFTNTTF